MVIIDFRFFEDYATDHLGSSSVLTNNDGSYHERIEYLPYGEVWVEDAAINSNYCTPYKFTGKELDKETGLYYFGAKYYDARISRWISTDPALEKYFPKPNDYDTEHDFYWYILNDASGKLPGMGGVYNSVNVNSYTFVSNNPIKYTDPNGLYTLLFVVSSNRNQTGKLYLYDDDNNLIASYNALGMGKHEERLKPYGDTPLGLYQITYKQENDEKSKRYETFGPLELVLVGISNDGTVGISNEAKEAYDNGRSGIEIHGGRLLPTPRYDTTEDDEGRYLNRTWGCIRISNDDAKDLAGKIKDIETKRNKVTGAAGTNDKVIVVESNKK